MIHEYNPNVYPFRLWVSVNPTFEEISERFYGIDVNMDKVVISQDQCHPDRFVVARTLTVCDKKNGWIGCFVGIYRRGSLKTSNICHEAAHCADFVCEQFGIKSRTFDDGEAYAYLVGWVAECINSVKNIKK